MRLSTYALRDFIANGYAEFPFPSVDCDSAPRAVISLSERGSMAFAHGVDNPNRRALFDVLGVDHANVAAVELVHSRDILFVDGADDAVGVQADGVLTMRRDVVPSVTVADCAPLWIFDASTGTFGVLHSGWKGTGILIDALDALVRNSGTDVSRVSIVMGPCIGTCCYDVDEARAACFMAEFGEDAVVRPGSADSGAWRLDLRAANIALARRSGVGAMAVVEDCTSCSGLLGSFRREGAATFTRMVALAGYFA